MCKAERKKHAEKEKVNDTLMFKSQRRLGGRGLRFRGAKREYFGVGYIHPPADPLGLTNLSELLCKRARNRRSYASIPRWAGWLYSVALGLSFPGLA